MLNRMRKRGLIKEYGDEEDKRSKRLQLTDKGLEACRLSLKKIENNARMLLHELGEEDVQLCIQLLKQVEIKLSARWPKDRGKPFDQIFQEMMPSPAEDHISENHGNQKMRNKVE